MTINNLVDEKEHLKKLSNLYLRKYVYNRDKAPIGPGTSFIAPELVKAGERLGVAQSSIHDQPPLRLLGTGTNHKLPGLPYGPSALKGCLDDESPGNFQTLKPNQGENAHPPKAAGYICDSIGINPSIGTSVPVVRNEELTAELTVLESDLQIKRGSRPRSESSNGKMLAHQDLSIPNQPKLHVDNNNANDQHTSSAQQVRDRYNSEVFQDLASLAPIHDVKPLKTKPAFLRLLPPADTASTPDITMPPMNTKQADPFWTVQDNSDLQSYSSITFDKSNGPFSRIGPSLDFDASHGSGGLTGVHVPAPSSPLLMDVGNELISMNSPDYGSSDHK